MRGSGGLFGFSVLEVLIGLFFIRYNRVIFRFINKSITSGDFESVMPGEWKNNQVPQGQLDKVAKYDPKNLVAKQLAYSDIASQAHEIMYGNNIFSPYDKLAELFSPLNKDELTAVYVAFGHAAEVRWGFIDVKPPSTLTQWLGDELSGEDLTNMKRIWAKTGLWR